MMGIKQREFGPIVNVSLDDLVAADNFYRHKGSGHPDSHRDGQTYGAPHIQAAKRHGPVSALVQRMFPTSRKVPS